MPRPRFYGNANLPGKPHGTVKTVPYKLAGNLHFPNYILPSGYS